MIKKYYIKIQVNIPKELEDKISSDDEILNELKELISDELSEETKSNILTSTNINDIILSEANYEL